MIWLWIPLNHFNARSVFVSSCPSCLVSQLFSLALNILFPLRQSNVHSRRTDDSPGHQLVCFLLTPRVVALVRMSGQERNVCFLTTAFTPNKQERHDSQGNLWLLHDIWVACFIYWWALKLQDSDCRHGVTTWKHCVKVSKRKHEWIVWVSAWLLFFFVALEHKLLKATNESPPLSLCKCTKSF